MTLMMLVVQAYKFALDPTPRQHRSLWSHCGAARFAYNWGLDLVKQRQDDRAAGLDVQVPWTLQALRWEWNRAKHQAAPWWPENSKEAYSSGLDALARGLQNWSDSKAGRRAGRTVGFPRRKAKRRTRPPAGLPLARSVSNPTDTILCCPASAGSGLMSPPASLLVASNTAPHASSPLPSPTLATAGT
jgi:transposase